MPDYIRSLQLLIILLIRILIVVMDTITILAILKILLHRSSPKKTRRDMVFHQRPFEGRLVPCLKSYNS